MKFVPFRTDAEPKSRELFLRALEVAPVGSTGMDFAQMSRRLRVMEAIEKVDENASGVELEDADCATLLDVINGARYQQASRAAMTQLLRIRDDLTDAKAPKKSD